MGERIEWEEIERRKQIAQALDDAIGARADCSGSAAVNRDWLRYIAALEAGEGMHEALAKHQRVGPRHEQECDWCRAMAEWRRCVAPRGEVRDARPL